MAHIPLTKNTLPFRSPHKTPYGKEDVDSQEHIAHVVEREYAEHDVVNSADGSQSSEIEHRIPQCQTVLHLVNGSYGKNKYGPYRSEEESQHTRHGKGIECGVEIEMAPCFGHESLDGGIKGC